MDTGQFSIGDRVRLRHDPSQSGEITGATREVAGKLYHAVRLGDGTGTRMFPALQLEPQVAEADALDDLCDGRLSPPEVLRGLLTHVRLTGRLSDMIYSMEATNTEFHAYQFKPVVKLLNAPTRGLLIADEVGLGKTIEAGLIWTELVARLDVSRLLVVCPKSLTEKWRLELRQKFNVYAQVVTARELLETLDGEATAPEGFARIVSLSSVRPPKDWEESASQGARAKLARHLRDVSGDRTLFDLIIFDEAHHLRNADTLGHTFATLAMAVCDYKLLLSATPINLRSEDLRNLLRLLDPETFENPYMFSLLEEENVPLVAAREKALNPTTSFADLLTVVQSIPRGEVLKIDQRLDILQKQLADAHLQDTPKVRAGIAAQLEEMSLLGSIVNRTRRRDVTDFMVKRRVDHHLWDMTPEARDFYAEASGIVAQYARELDASERFLLATPQRLIASSLPAAFEHWGASAADFSVDDPDVRQRGAGPLVSKLSAICQDRARLDALKANDTKYGVLQRALRQGWGKSPSEKVIVFSSFRRTIDYLAARLAEDGIPAEVLHGSIKEDRQSVINRFGQSGKATVLLTSEVGGEGLDLQFCRSMINYDLPWNPMKVEQRIGRIDRIGQKAPSIEVISLVCRDTIEQQIYERLYNRIMNIERTLGSFEAILGAEMADLERRLLNPELSDEEKAREVERSALAVENRQKNQEELEKEASGLIAHGDMILARIYENYRPERRIVGRELADYVAQGLAGRFPGSRVDSVEGESDLFDVFLTAEAQFALAQFVSASGTRYRTALRREQRVRMAFARGSGLDSRYELVGNVHPLVRFAASIREDAARTAPLRPAVALELSRKAADGLPPAGRYRCAVQSWSVEGLVRSDLIAFAACGTSANLLDSETAEALLRTGLEHGKWMLRADTEDFREDAADIRRFLVEGDLDRRFGDFIAEEQARHDDRAATSIAQLEKYRDKKKVEVEDRLRTWRLEDKPSQRNLMKAEEAKLERLLARLKHKIEDQQRKAESFHYTEMMRAVAVIEVVE